MSENENKPVFRTVRTKKPLEPPTGLHHFKRVVENLAQDGVHGTVIRRLRRKATDADE